ncbi:LacI family DNA-binding transcriptional regulator [Treponema primitia]|uniref:LacI family DNA-binding transcriptional regulator n=1 Tax=Treponema primitia TaxID=88058 RepID=UPI00397E95EE
MKVTIKDIAKQAGVSIATVSHVINSTRYVSPELVEKINTIIKKSAYKKDTYYKIRVGKMSAIALLVPGLEDYILLADVLSRYFSQAGFTLSISVTNDDINTEKFLLTTLLSNKSVGGIILVPAANNSEYYNTILNRSIPFVLAGRHFPDNRIDSVTTDYEAALYKITTYLLQCGHERIGLVTEKKEFSTSVEQILGYHRALIAYGIDYRQEMVMTVNSNQGDLTKQQIFRFCKQEKPSAIVSGANWITPRILQLLDDLGLEYPKQLSFIGAGNKGWTELIDPPITTMEENYEAMGAAISSQILDKIRGGSAQANSRKIQANFLLRKSTRLIGKGPFGGEAISMDALTLSEKEQDALRKGHFKVCISFHYDNSAWTRLHENGIRDTLEKYGIRILAVTDAHFNPDLQITQLEGLRMQKPDAIIAIPADDIKTAAKFKELAKETKLIFISSIPAGMTADEYASCISVNEREYGYNAGVLLGEYFKNRTGIQVGFINHGADFRGTHLRDSVAEQVIREDYPSIEIAAVEDFYQIERTYDVCKKMIAEHPNIKGLYISWDRPALQAIRALKELGREDIAIITFDLDREIALHFAQGDIVQGLVIQQPYAQGTAVALATLKALLEQGGYKYIGISPYVVQKNKLLKAWEDIFHAPAPEELKNAMAHNFT